MRNNVLLLKPILFTLLFFLSVLSHAQRNKRDVVYLKNGSIIKGTILEMIPNETIKIETADGSVFIYKLEEVEKTTVEEIPARGRRPGVRRENTSEKKIEEFSPTGYFILARFGPNFNPSIFKTELSAGLISGFQINKNVSLGVGVEFVNYTYSDHPYDNNYQNSNTIIFPGQTDDGKGSNVPIIPIFFDARFYIPLQRVHPMFSFQIGYSTVGQRQEDPNYKYIGFIPSSGQGGLYVAFGGGIRVFINSKISLVADAGFSFQNLKGYGTSLNDVQEDYQSKNIDWFKTNVGAVFSFGKNVKKN